jgi:hypothetical protein
MGNELTPASIAELAKVLGARTVALIGAADSTSAVRRWVQGTEVPQERAWRFEYTTRACRILLTRVGDSTLRAWFWGANHDLSDNTPIAVLASSPRSECEQVLVAAGSFAAM